MSKAFLHTHELTKKFDDVTAVNGVSLQINKGEIFALVGSSGCGKSTLLRMLAGFETPSGGSIHLGGKNITHLAPFERPVNMMFQSYALFPHMSVFENVAFGLRREGVGRHEVDARVNKMLGKVQLSALAQRKPHELSGGQQQRVALARALIKQPQLLLLDEPMGALDKQLREHTRFELVNIIESFEVTCVLVTHDQEEAMAMASRIAVMDKGTVCQVGTPLQMYEAPNSTFVAQFIGAVNIIPGTVLSEDASGCAVHTAMGVVRSAPCGANAGAPVNIAVRPEKIEIAKSAHSEGCANCFEGTVQEIGYMGSYTNYVVSIVLPEGTRHLLKITEPNTERHVRLGITWGERVFVSWNVPECVTLTR